MEEKNGRGLLAAQNPPASAGDTRLIPGPEELQASCGRVPEPVTTAEPVPPNKRSAQAQKLSIATKTSGIADKIKLTN